MIMAAAEAEVEVAAEAVARAAERRY